MPVCQTCGGSGEYKSGCHLIACPACDGDGKAAYTEEDRYEDAQAYYEELFNYNHSENGEAPECPW